MKKSLIATAVAVLLLGVGASPSLATGATGELPEPSGEEYAVTLTVPSAPGGCATSPADIAGVEDLYVDYGGTPELVATWSMVEDAKGFLVTATLVSKYYSLNNPLNPGRSTSATFSIPRCAPAPVTPAPEVPGVPPVIVEPVIPEEPAPVAPVTPVAPVVVEPVVTAPTGPAVPVGPVVAAPAPVVAAPAPVVAAPAPVPAPAVSPAPLAVTGEAPAAPEVVVAAPEALANTGAREDLLFLLGGVALALLLVGGVAVVAGRKS